MISKKIGKYISIFILLSSFCLFQCSRSGGTATVTINLGFPGHESAQQQSFIDRLLGLFLVKAYAQPPTDIESFLVRVTGPDMGTIEYGFSADTTTITVVVPAGEARTISVIAAVSPLSESAALAFTGKETLDLNPGEEKSISVTMIVSETKLVLPDYSFVRVVQFDDISGANSRTRNGGDISFLGTFRPYDIDFDAQGRILVAVNTVGSGSSAVIRLNDMTTTSYDLIADDTGFVGIVALAVDRENSMIYYATNSELYRWDLINSIRTQLTITGIGTIRGMDIDENGILYIAGRDGAGNDRIFKYDTDLEIQSVIAVYDNTSVLADPWDTLVRPPYVYVANVNEGALSNSILQLNTDLQHVQGYGDDIDGTDTNKGKFYGPHRFAAILNEKITIIDDDSFTSNNDKLVSMDDINGTGWATLPTSGDGQSLFYFFNWC